MAFFRNQATLSYNGSSTNSNVVVGEITEVLSAAKHAPVDTYQTGDQLTYVVSIANSGSTPFTDLTVTDELGGYEFEEVTRYPLTYVEDSVALFVNGVLQEDVTVEAGPPLEFSGISVPAGGSAVLVYEARVNEFADPTSEGSITNTAVISGTGLSTPLQVSETVNGESAVLLSITKALSPVPVAENGRLTYTFVIENYGSRDAVETDDLSVTDEFDPILSDLDVSLNGEEWTEGEQYTYDETTGFFTTQPGQITVPVATVTRDPETGAFITTPGVATLVVTGTV